MSKSCWLGRCYDRESKIVAAINNSEEMFDLVKSSLDNRKQRALFQCIAGSLANAAGTERQDVIDRKPIPESLDEGFVLVLIEGSG